MTSIEGELRARACAANAALYARDLAHFTFGNASVIDRTHGVIYIKPSGVEPGDLTAARMVAVSLDGAVHGTLRPSSDTPTHLALYRAFPSVGGIVHTHSRFATAWAQAAREVPCLGTTHADFCDGAVPLTEALGAAEVAGDYEANTGHAIARRLAGLDPLRVPAILVRHHAPFTWGRTVEDAVAAAEMLEEVAQLAWLTSALVDRVPPIDAHLLRKHFDRKHGVDAYYGQPRRDSND